MKDNKSASLFQKEQVIDSIKQSFVKLNPRVMIKNPIMFTVEVCTAIMFLVMLYSIVNDSQGSFIYNLWVFVILFITLLFANFAEAIAEARGKAQADSLRKTREETPAKLIVNGTLKTVSSSRLKKGDIFVCEAGDVIPADGEIIEGLASIDESAITGESAPVIREAGGDKSSVTGGTKVLSDQIKVMVSTQPGESFLDKMIALVEGASRQKTPNEIALTILLAAFTLVFVIVCITLKPFADYFFMYMGTQDVHVPRVPHARFAGKSGMGTRGDVILQLDWTVGEIMNTLDSLNLADNTIFVFCSDNGPVIDDGYQDQALELLNGHTPMKQYRGGKYSAYEAGTRIPFIVRWPAGIQPCKQQALFSMIDVYASLAALLNHPLTPATVAPDSRDQLATFLGKDNTGCDYIVQQNLNNTLSIIQGTWKYIEPSDKPAIEHWTKMELGNDPKPQLYNISIDPSEKDNVAAAHPEMVKELSALLEQVKAGKHQGIK